MSMSREEVAKVAFLARLRLSPEELDTFTGQLSSIVDFVAQLQERIGETLRVDLDTADRPRREMRRDLENFHERSVRTATPLDYSGCVMRGLTCRR